MKDNRKTALLIAALLTCITGALILFALVFYLRSPGLPVTPPPSPLIVSILAPADNASVVNGQAIAIGAEAASTSPLQYLELWADGRLVERAEPPSSDMTRLSALWNWAPTAEGMHILTARARDAGGEVQNAGIVRVQSLAAPAFTSVSARPNKGESLNGMAEALNVPPDVTAGLNPGIDPNAILPEGQPVWIPVKSGPKNPNFPDSLYTPGGETENAPPPLPPPPPPEPEPTAPPLPPVLTGAVDGCSNTLEFTAASDNASDFRLEAYMPGSQALQPIKTFGGMKKGEKQVYIHKDLFGLYVYGVTAFNKLGSAQSNLVVLKVVDGACVANAKPADNIKIITSMTLDRLYCYVTIDEKTYFRMPIDPEAFISPMPAADLDAWKAATLKGSSLTAAQGFDIARQLPALYPKALGNTGLRFDCAGWAGNGLIDLGSASGSLTNFEMNKFAVLSGKDFQVVGIFNAADEPGPDFLFVPDPINFKLTGNPEVCVKHASSSEPSPEYNCKKKIGDGYAAFIWDTPTASYCFPGSEKWCSELKDVDGFRVYRHSGGLPDAVSVAFQVSGGTGGFMPWPSQPACYTVRAFKGMIESKGSNAVCLQDPATQTGTKTVYLQPDFVGVHTKLDSNIGLGVENTGDSKKGELVSGYLYWNEDDIYAYRIKYGLVRFNMDDIRGHPVLSSKLHYSIKNTFHEFGDDQKHYDITVCAAGIGVNTSGFIYPGVSQSAPHYKKVVYPMPWNGLADVTIVVKTWAGKTDNNGFVIDGYKIPSAWEHDLCESTFGDFQLEVTYFPNE